MHGLHPRLKVGPGFRPHQIDITEFTAQIERRWRIAAEIEEWPPILLIGTRRIGIQPLKLVNLAIMVDFILRPGLFENLYHLARTVIAIGTFLGLAGKVRADNIDRQPAFQHVIQCRQCACQHDGLHLSAPHGSQKIDLMGQRGTSGNKGQRVLPDLIG